MSGYYENYQPKNERHFREMLNQFRKAPDRDSRELMAVVWTLDDTVNREDIVVALGRAEREAR